MWYEVAFPISVNWTAWFKLLNPHKFTAKQSLIKTTYQDNKSIEKHNSTGYPLSLWQSVTPAHHVKTLEFLMGLHVELSMLLIFIYENNYIHNIFIIFLLQILGDKLLLSVIIWLLFCSLITTCHLVFFCENILKTLWTCNLSLFLWIIGMSWK